MTKDILADVSSKSVSVARKILVGFAIIIGLPISFFLGLALDFMSYGKSSGVGLRSIAIFTLMVPAMYIFGVGYLLVKSRRRKQSMYKQQVRNEVLEETGRQPASVEATLLQAAIESPGATLEELVSNTGISKEDALPAVTALLNQKKITQKFVDGKTVIEPGSQV